MTDYMVRATAADAQIRAFAVTSRELVEYARAAHDTSPVVTAALGRLMTGALMMGSMLKGEEDILTLQIRGDGPVHGLTATADSAGHVKGYADNPQAMMPPNSAGKLDVGGVIGAGVLHVMKDMGLKEPYASTVTLQTGEIGDDLTYYFAASEQVPSVVALGVLMNRDNTVRQAGGFIMQLMPFTSEDVISRLEEKLTKITSVTELLEEGKTPEEILENVLGEFGLEITDRMPVSFRCDCSRERVEKVLISLGKKDRQELINEGKDVELHCHFCSRNYVFSVEEIKNLA
ncbi:MAG: Hsp33 family molecular chaperone HslO [Lachnospiraceae bacterium]|nr:Hsp33 family molecular chaperone HslO [Lachnospiraceae bacterium]MDE7177520.1 Hsp33 family molecular chaperone HslO [Lachnospiraceae bacterium]